MSALMCQVYTRTGHCSGEYQVFGDAKDALVALGPGSCVVRSSEVIYWHAGTTDVERRRTANAVPFVMLGPLAPKAFGTVKPQTTITEPKKMATESRDEVPECSEADCGKPRGTVTSQTRKAEHGLCVGHRKNLAQKRYRLEKKKGRTAKPGRPTVSVKLATKVPSGTFAAAERAITLAVANRAMKPKVGGLFTLAEIGRALAIVSTLGGFDRAERLAAAMASQ